MILPTIHLNGTSREELRDQISRADRAADALREALVCMAPNGRDYYPQGNNAIRLALLEHEERITKVNQIIADLNVLAEHTFEGAA